MTATSPGEEPTVAAACAALRPHRWRSFTPELMARLVLAARDRQSVRALLVTVPGAAVGRWRAVDLAEPDDVRVKALVRFLESRRWTHLTVQALCVQMLAVVADL